MLLAWARRRLTGAAVPMLFLALCGYFAHHATAGSRGTEAREARRAEVAAARVVLAAAEAERDAMERKVAALRGERLDRDVLEERARALLNLVARDEVVVPYAPGRQMF